MFILVQLPLADLRPMIPGEMGRVDVPDWTADDPGLSFVRGFGKMATRNSEGFGLFGERAFADFNNAARLRETLYYRQEGWLGTMRVELRFRRLYFDGKLAGRFEYGFFVPDNTEDYIVENATDFAYDLGSLAASAQALSMLVRSSDDHGEPTTVGASFDPLGLGYVMATTKQNAIAEFPPAEIYKKAVIVGRPIVHIRVSNGRPVKASNDRREIEGSKGSLFITSADRAQIRNNVIVQLSNERTIAETPAERAIRVTFSHMNALVFAENHFLKVHKDLKLGPTSVLGHAVKDMLNRFERSGPTGPLAENDGEFAAALKVFAGAYSGKADDLVDRIKTLAADLAKPSLTDRVIVAAKSPVQWLTELVVKTFVETTTKAALKSS
jgi:hypothetical protein